MWFKPLEWWNDYGEICTRIVDLFIEYYKLGGSSPECRLADSRGIRDRIQRVGQNMYFHRSSYVGNQFIIAVRHLRGLWYIGHIPHLLWPYFLCMLHQQDSCQLSYF